MNETNTSKISPKDFQLIAVITLASILHWGILILGIPVLDKLPYWKFTLMETPIHLGWIFIALAAFVLAVAISFSRMKTALQLFLLIILGATMQFSFAFSKGQGLDGIRNRFLKLGHAEFTKFAAREPYVLNAAQNYEDLSKEERFDYIPSKPPGTLIFYIISEQIANFNKGDIPSEERADNFSTLASITWPFLSLLVLIPLYSLARTLHDDTVAVTACLLYLSVPSINLITAHTDQSIYPILALLPTVLIVLAVQKGSAWYAFASGAAFYMAVYFSFGLGVVGLFCALPFITKFGSNWRKDFRASIKLLGFTALSIVMCDLLARTLLSYDILLRYTNAIRHHAEWKAWHNDLDTLLRSSITNLTEFSVWIGIPLSIFLAAAIVYALYQLAAHRKINTSTILPTLLLGVFVFLLAFGKTKAETARLWIFLIPIICLIVADFLNDKLWTGGNKKLLLLILVFYEFATTYLTLHYQDFR